MKSRKFSESRRGENEGQIEGELKPLQPVQIEVLQNAGMELVSDYSSLSYLKFPTKTEEAPGYFRFHHGFLEAIPKSGITKPVIVFGGTEEVKIPSVNEVLEAIAQDNVAREVLKKFPNLRFPRNFPDAVVSNIKGGDRVLQEAGYAIPSDREERLELFSTISHGYATRCFLTLNILETRRFTDRFFGPIGIANLLKSLKNRADRYLALDQVYQSLRAEMKNEGKFVLKPPSLYDKNLFQEKYERFLGEDPMLGAGLIFDHLLEEAGSYDNIRLQAIDYIENFYPEKLNEVADLQDDINNWIRSLKVGESQ